MSTVSCEQLRYTWAERRLGGVGGGFGVVLRSRGWPGHLLDDPSTRTLLTTVPDDRRRELPEGSVTDLTHVRVGRGSLLVAARPVGKDGAGRPGNYVVHALFDPSGTLGQLDLRRMVTAGVFALERSIEVVPLDDADPLPVEAPARWSPDELSEPDRTWCRSVPAALVNQLEEHELDTLPPRFSGAVALGAADDDLWWTRCDRSVEDWVEAYDEFTVRHLPVEDLTDDLLWARWDVEDEPGRAHLIGEVLRRPRLLDDRASVDEVERRPDLLALMVERGLRGRPAQRSTVAAWVARAGTEDQIVDVAAELVRPPTTAPLPRTLLDRLQRIAPAFLPRRLSDVVAATLDGGAPMDGAWRSLCLERRLATLPTCLEPELLVASASMSELEGALRTVTDRGVALQDSWAALAPLTASRRAAVVSSLGVEGVEFLLQLDALKGLQRSQQLELWRQAAVISGWAPWTRRLPVELDREGRRLRAQRSVLLVVAGVLMIAILTLLALLLLLP